MPAWISSAAGSMVLARAAGSATVSVTFSVAGLFAGTVMIAGDTETDTPGMVDAAR